MSFSIISAVGKNLEIGKDNHLIFNLKEDMRFFKSTTMEHKIIMGKNTFDSIGRALPGRTNFVLAHDPSGLPDTVTPVTNLDHFLEEYKNSPEEIFVIGGASVYRAFLPYAATLYLTEINAAADADTFFPAFDHTKYDKIIIKKGNENDLAFVFAKYTLK